MTVPIMALPASPMAPVLSDRLPAGDGWTYQLKWDGVRVLAAIGEDGTVQLWSRKLLLKNAVYPEIVRQLRERAGVLGPCLLDGEVVYWDGERPNFQKVLQRERSGRPAARSETAELAGQPEPGGEPEAGGSALGDGALAFGRIDKLDAFVARLETGLLYVLFDLLQDRSRNLRELPYKERHLLLGEKIASVQTDKLFRTNVYEDGESLWRWVQQHRWEGVVSKRLDSPYREGKKHRDWLKKKTAVLLDVSIVGVKRREGHAASLIMSYSGFYIGSVSLGLDGAMLRLLDETIAQMGSGGQRWPMPFSQLPGELKKEDVFWLPNPLPCRVTGLELTSAGQLRHPKLVSFGAPGAAP